MIEHQTGTTITLHSEITLPSEPFELEEDMYSGIMGTPFHCRNSACNNRWTIRLSSFGNPFGAGRKDGIVGTATCSMCGTKTVFTYAGGAVDRITEGPADSLPSSPQQVKDTYEEASLAYYSRAFRAAAGMARVAIEESLSLKGVVPKNKKGVPIKSPRLEDYIVEAKNMTLLDNTHESDARGAQLIGNRVLHRMESVTPQRCLNALLTTSELVEHIATWQPA